MDKKFRKIGKFFAQTDPCVCNISKENTLILKMFYFSSWKNFHGLFEADI